MTDKQNRIENDAAGCARLQEVAFTLSAKQGIAVATLCSGAGVDAAAAAAGVNPSTIWRWRELPGFRDAEREANARVFDLAAGELQALGAVAVATLRELLQHDNPAIRLRAGCAALSLALRRRRAIELEARLADLETKPGKPPASEEAVAAVPRSASLPYCATDIIPYAQLERRRDILAAEVRASCHQYIPENDVRTALLADAENEWDEVPLPEPSTPVTRSQASNLLRRFRQAVVNAAIRHILDETARMKLCADIDNRLQAMPP